MKKNIFKLQLLFACSVIFTAISQSVRVLAAPQPVPIEKLMYAPIFPSIQLQGSISQDGTAVAYFVQYVTPKTKMYMNDKYSLYIPSGAPSSALGLRLLVREVTLRKTYFINDATSNVWGATWSPDGKTLAYYSDAGGRACLWIWNRRTHRSHQLASTIVHSSDSPQWSADGRRLLVTLLPLHESVDALLNVAYGVNSTGIHEFYSRASTVGYRSFDKFAKLSMADIAIVDVKSGSIDRIAFHRPVGWMRFMRDGRSAIFTQTDDIRNGNNHDVDIGIYVAERGQNPRAVTKNLSSDSSFLRIALSEDEKELSFITTGRTNDWLIIRLMDGKTTKITLPQNLVQSLNVAPNYLAGPAWDKLLPSKCYFTIGNELWSASMDSPVALKVASVASADYIYLPELDTLVRDGRKRMLILLRNAYAQTSYALLDTGNGAIRRVRIPGLSYYDGLVALSGSKAAFIAQSATQPPEVYIADLRSLTITRISSITPDLERYHYGSSRIFSWTARNGHKLSAMVILPTGYQKGRRYPLIVWSYGIHPDQSGFANIFGGWAFKPFNMQVYATRGYAVLFAPTENNGSIRRDVAQTIVEAVQRTIQKGIADPNRVGIFGESFGGYNTLAAITSSTIFKAAVVNWGVVDLTSAFGTLDPDGSPYSIGIVKGMVGGSEPWSSPQQYIENSPIYHLDRITAPVLILHGSQDPAVPLGQADELFVGLEYLGKMTEYVRYDGEGHGLENPVDQLNAVRRTLQWFEMYVKR